MRGIETRTGIAETYWDIAAETYERDFTGTLIGQTRRRAVLQRLERIFQPGQRILELNCGTGIDAVHLAGRGIRVLACDISPGMIHRARRLASATGAGDRIDFRVLATEKISILANEGPFDGAFSNFSGLNCVEDLSAVVEDLALLLKPGAPVLVCMMGRFVPWEITWFLAHRNWERAIHRLGQRHSRSHVEQDGLTICRPRVKEIVSLFAPRFRLRRWRGIGIAVPPSYTELSARRFPGLITLLAALDARIGGLPPFRSMADQVVLEFEAHSLPEAVNDAFGQ